MTKRTVFSRYHANLLRQASKGSRSAAVRAFCLECMGGDRKEVERCTAPECPLFGFRLAPDIVKRAAEAGG